MDIENFLSIKIYNDLEEMYPDYREYYAEASRLETEMFYLSTCVYLGNHQRVRLRVCMHLVCSQISRRKDELYVLEIRCSFWPTTFLR